MTFTVCLRRQSAKVCWSWMLAEQSFVYCRPLVINKPQIDRAITALDEALEEEENERAAAVRFLTNLLGIYSPSGKEQDIANFLAIEMKHMGFEVGIDNIGNVIGVIGSGEPVILLCGHMDTVAGHMPLRFEEGKIYARGAVDAKGPLAAMVMAAEQAGKDPGL